MPVLLLAQPVLGLPAPREAAIDWSGVPDAVVARCGLMGLENLMVQELLRAGLAVTGHVTAEGFAVALGADGEALRVVVAYRGALARRQVTIPIACDGSIQLDLTHAMLDAIRELDLRSIAPAVQPERAARRPWQLQLGAVASLPGTRHAAAGVSAVGRFAPVGNLVFGAGGEITLSRYGGVLIAEPAGFGQVLRGVMVAGELEVRLGVEAGVLRHLYWADDGAGGRFDFRLGAPAELAGERLVFALMPYLRRLSIRHIVGEDVAYHSEVWGIELRAAMAIL